MEMRKVKPVMKPMTNWARIALGMFLLGLALV